MIYFNVFPLGTPSKIKSLEQGVNYQSLSNQPKHRRVAETGAKPPQTPTGNWPLPKKSRSCGTGCW